MTKSNLVLDDASIKINTKINLIIGTSGVGKSTLLNIMGCLIRPDSGKLLYGNKTYDLQKDNMNDFRISSYSYLFQIIICYQNLMSMIIFYYHPI